MKTVSILSFRRRFISAIWNSNSKSDTARKPAHDHLRLTSFDVVDQQAVERIDFDVREALEHFAGHLDALGHRENSGAFSAFTRIATMIRSNSRAPRVMMST